MHLIILPVAFILTSRVPSESSFSMKLIIDYKTFIITSIWVFDAANALYFSLNKCAFHQVFIWHFNQTFAMELSVFINLSLVDPSVFSMNPSFLSILISAVKLHSIAILFFEIFPISSIVQLFMFALPHLWNRLLYRNIGLNPCLSFFLR